MMILLVDNELLSPTPKMQKTLWTVIKEVKQRCWENWQLPSSYDQIIQGLLKQDPKEIRRNCYREISLDL